MNINVPVLGGKPLGPPIVKPEPPPLFPPEVIDKAQKIYSSKYANTGPGGKSAAVDNQPPTAIPPTGAWGKGE